MRMRLGSVSVGLVFVGPRIVSPRIVSPIFGSHVSKDYSRKSCFDKFSKHFFRENPGRTPAVLVVKPAARVLRPQSLAQSGTPGRGQAAAAADIMAA